MNLVDYLTPNQQSIQGNFAQPQINGQSQLIAPIGQSLGGGVTGSGTGKLHNLLQIYKTALIGNALGSVGSDGIDFTDKSRMTDGSTFPNSNLA